MTIKYHTESDGSPLIQGSDSWRAARCGLLTASEMKLIITPTLKVASNDKERAHLWELLAQRITGYVEPHYIGDDMLRGIEEEIYARATYAEHYAPVEEVGFITNDDLGFPIGFSPDGLVGNDGFIECKSRRQKFQVETILEHVATSTIPDEYMIQIQTGFLVTGRRWCDFISYCGGLPMVTIRVEPDKKYRDAIEAAAAAFEWRLTEKLKNYHDTMKTARRLIPTERRVEQEII